MGYKPVALSISALALSAFLGTSAAQNPEQAASPAGQPATAHDHLSKAGQRFLIEAAEGNWAEIELGTLAEQKAGSPAVRDYGHRLVQDHSKANERLHRIAVANGIEWPNSTDKKQAKTRHELSELSGDRFDKKFMKDMVKDHEKDIHDYQKAEKKVDNSQLQQYVQNTLPTLHEHLQLARQVRQEVTHEQHQAER